MIYIRSKKKVERKVSSALSQATFIIILTMASALSQEASALGKKFFEQGSSLTKHLSETLIEKGFCGSGRECYDLLPGSFETDSLILLHYYEVNESNLPAFLEIIATSISDGIPVTNGIPIRIKAFRETHEEYRKSGIFIKDVKPFMVMEIDK